MHVITPPNITMDAFKDLDAFFKWAQEFHGRGASEACRTEYETQKAAGGDPNPLVILASILDEPASLGSTTMPLRIKFIC